MTVGIVTGAGRGMGAACAERVADMVDVLVLVDRDEVLLATQADMLAAAGHRGPGRALRPRREGPGGITRLAARAAELGPLRAVAHAAGVSPTMADWREILTVNLVGTALLVEACRLLAGPGTAVVCFASVAALLALDPVDLPPDAVLDDPLADDFLENDPRGRRSRDRGPRHGLHVEQAWGAPAGPARGRAASARSVRASARSRRA